MAEPEGSAVLDAADFLMLGLIPSSVNAAETGNTTTSVAAPNNNEAVNYPPLPLQQDASAPLDGSGLLNQGMPGTKKRGRPEGSEGQQTKKRKRARFIDLTGVPPQPLILRNKATSSKFMGAYYYTAKSKWKSRIVVEGKVRFIGYYDNEEHAAADYARAAYKYKKKKIRNDNEEHAAADYARAAYKYKKKKIRNDNEEHAAADYARAAYKYKKKKIRNVSSNVYGGLDLSGVPVSLPLIRNEKAITGFAGVKKINQRFQARIIIRKKMKSLGTFATSEEAARIYARAKWYVESIPRSNVLAYKYKKKKIRNGSSNVYGGLDLSGVPVSLPLIRNEKATTGFAGVTKLNQRFQARIFIRKKWQTLGTFATPEEAARIYARAKWYVESIPQRKKKKSRGMPSGSAEGPAADSSDTGFIAEFLDTRGANSGGNDGKNADDDPVGGILDEDPVDTSYMSDGDYSEVDGVAV